MPLLQENAQNNACIMFRGLLKGDARFTTRVSNLSSNKSSCYRLRKVVAKSRTELFIFFFFLIGNQIHSAGIPLRISVIQSKLKQFAIQGRLYDFGFFSPGTFAGSQ